MSYVLLHVCIVVLGAFSACCTWHMCWLYVCVVVLGVHQVLSVLVALGIYVGYISGAWSVPGAVYVLAICIVGCLACIRMLSGK